MVGLGKCLLNDLPGLLLETGPHALSLRTGTRCTGKAAAGFGNHIFGGANERGNRIHGCHSGHAFSVFLFPFGQPLAHFVGPSLGGLAGLLAQIPCQHRHPLAIDTGHQHRAGALTLGSRSVPRIVKNVEVHRRALDQLFDLALGDMAAGVFANALKCFVKGALCGFFGHSATQFKRIALIGQIQFGIQRVKTLDAFLSISRTFDRDGTQYCFQLSPLGPYPWTFNPVGTAYRLVAFARAAVI